MFTFENVVELHSVLSASNTLVDCLTPIVMEAKS